MAKKKAKAAKPKKAAPKSKAKTTKKATQPAKAAAKAPARKLRQPALPGTEQIRNLKLDRICEGIAEVRREMSRNRGENDDLMRQGVQVMQADKVTVYRNAGVELVLVPGDVHLRVRTMKDTANADVVPDDESDDAGDDAPLTADELQDAADELSNSIGKADDEDE